MSDKSTKSTPKFRVQDGKLVEIKGESEPKFEEELTFDG